MASRNQKFNCPFCGAQNEAKVSETYPSVVVHKCFGEKLVEVGEFKNNQFRPFSKPNNPYRRPIQFETEHFDIFNPKTPIELNNYGKKLKNANANFNRATYYLNQPEITILVAKDKHNYDVKFMILIKDQTIPGLQYFSGHGQKPIPKNEGMEIILKLIEQKLINKNPFPTEYPV